MSIKCGVFYKNGRSPKCPQCAKLVKHGDHYAIVGNKYIHGTCLSPTPNQTKFSGNYPKQCPNCKSKLYSGESYVLVNKRYIHILCYHNIMQEINTYKDKEPELAPEKVDRKIAYFFWKDTLKGISAKNYIRTNTNTYSTIYTINSYTGYKFILRYEQPDALLFHPYNSGYSYSYSYDGTYDYNREKITFSMYNPNVANEIKNFLSQREEDIRIKQEQRNQSVIIKLNKSIKSTFTSKSSKKKESKHILVSKNSILQGLELMLWTMVAAGLIISSMILFTNIIGILSK